MKKLRPWILLALVFTAGFLGGVAVTRAVVRHTLQQALKNPDFLQAKIERRLLFALRLDARQRVKVHQILAGAQEDLKRLRGEFQPQFSGIMARAQSEIAEALTPEQQARFARFQQENKSLWQPR
jgi:hypothetical protein